MSEHERPGRDGSEVYPKPMRLYPTRDQRRLWKWAGDHHGIGQFDFPVQAADHYARHLIARMVRDGKRVPPDIAQLAGGTDREDARPTNKNVRDGIAGDGIGLQ